MAEVIQLGVRQISDDAVSPIKRVYGKSRMCFHDYTELDENKREVTCRDCGAVLDPIEVLSKLSHSFERWAHERDHARRQAEYEEKRLADLKRQVRNAKAQLRRRGVTPTRTRP